MMALQTEQTKKWGLLYDELKFVKQAADQYIDDKAATPPILNELINKIQEKSKKDNS